MIFTIKEIIDMVIMSIALGFIFQGVIKKPRKSRKYDPLLSLQRKSWFNLEDFWYAMAIIAPTILLHEFGHKFVAIGFGAHATFQAAYTWLGLGIILKLLNFGFLFFVPAFVSIQGNVTSLQSSLIAFAGPFMNLILWLGSMYLLKTKKFSVNVTYALHILSYVNKYLFIFNMLPIPLFDGFKVYTGLYSALF